MRARSAGPRPTVAGMRATAFVCFALCALLVPVTPSLAAGDWAWPVRGQVLTEFRNGDDPYAAGQHRGVDIAAPVGTPVVAAAPGTVVFAGVVGSSGLVVSERSGDGRYELSYLHLSAASVRRGQTVGRGATLGSVGVSGTRSAEQPHLHFGVREAGDRHAYLDPLPFLAAPPAEAPEPRAVPVTAHEPVAAPPLPETLPAAVGASVPGLVARHPAHLPHAAPGPHPVAARQVTAPHMSVTAPPHAPHLERDRPTARAVAHHGPSRDPVRPPAHGPASTAPRATAGAPRAGAEPHRHAGVDRGWLAACAGLVLAAALLAAPGRDRRGRPTARRAFGALMRAASRP
jgi:hypothetical protein